MSLLALSDLLTARGLTRVREGDVDQLRDLQRLLIDHLDLVEKAVDHVTGRHG